MTQTAFTPRAPALGDHSGNGWRPARRRKRGPEPPGKTPGLHKRRCPAPSGVSCSRAGRRRRSGCRPDWRRASPRSCSDQSWPRPPRSRVRMQEGRPSAGDAALRPVPQHGVEIPVGAGVGALESVNPRPGDSRAGFLRDLGACPAHLPDPDPEPPSTLQSRPLPRQCRTKALGVPALSWWKHGAGEDQGYADRDPSLWKESFGPSGTT